MNDKLTDTVDHIAKQDDRWLMVAILVIATLGAVVVWRWMVADREKVSARLTQMTDRHIEVTEKLIEVVANNNAVLHEVRKKL